MDDRRAYLVEYNSSDAVAKYGAGTAGAGIEHNLTNVYGQVYEEILDAIQRGRSHDEPFRMLEYGCGAGMNLLYLVQLLGQRNLTLTEAVGTDFSETLVETAKRDREDLPAPYNQASVSFVVASNEHLCEELATQLSRPKAELANQFDLIVGVNTFRYALRLGKGVACSQDIAYLLKPGGFSIMIDMNDKFPLFRSRLRDRKLPESQVWLPTLTQYAAPFAAAGLEVVQRRNFCWVPHSADGLLLIVMRSLSRLLEAVVPSYAMRSLVVAQKPVSTAVAGATPSTSG